MHVAVAERAAVQVLTNVAQRFSRPLWLCPAPEHRRCARAAGRASRRVAEEVDGSDADLSAATTPRHRKSEQSEVTCTCTESILFPQE